MNGLPAELIPLNDTRFYLVAQDDSDFDTLKERIENVLHGFGMDSGIN